jgi:hypothetical protein
MARAAVSSRNRVPVPQHLSEEELNRKIKEKVRYIETHPDAILLGDDPLFIRTESALDEFSRFMGRMGALSKWSLFVELSEICEEAEALQKGTRNNSGHD